MNLVFGVGMDKKGEIDHLSKIVNQMLVLLQISIMHMQKILKILNKLH